MKRTTFDEAKAIDMWVMKKQGTPVPYITKIMKVSKTAVYNWIKQVNKDPNLRAAAKLALAQSKQDKMYKKSAPSVEGGSKADQIRAWLEKHPEGTKGEFVADTGMEISQSQFSDLKNKRFRGTKPYKAPDKIADTVTHISSLSQENDFLRWWNLGERKGWVDRLLSELKKAD